MTEQHVVAPTATAPIESPPDRRAAIGTVSEITRERVTHFLDLSSRGLRDMYSAKGARFAQTMRAVQTSSGVSVRPEGDNLRYASIVALGLAQLTEPEQRSVLSETTAAQLALTTVDRAASATDSGAIALAAWSAAETAGHFASNLFRRMETILRSGEPVPTVDCAWMLTAALAARNLGDVESIIASAAARLNDAQGSRGIFPHALPAESLGRWRAHVGCFADQVYPIQALARLHASASDPRALASAQACADRICELQGEAGQWWWHYDARDGTVVEGYPVYSVHQHAMAPMALFDLQEAGGNGHLDAIARGVAWLDRHPEVMPDLVSESRGVIWRKVGRREPPKAARSISAVTTSLRPGLHLPGLNRVFPSNQIDYECRPYELGWLIYAWRSGGIVSRAPRRLAARDE